MTNGFVQAGAQLDGIAQEQAGLAAQVAAGQLWMEAGVAEEAALRCDKAVEEIGRWLRDTRTLIDRRRFGDNEDGWAAEARFINAGQEYLKVMTEARAVFVRMAETYRAAGRTVAQADEASEQMFGGVTP